MKDLITAIAAMAILMVFVLQFSANQVIINKILASDRVTDSYRMMLSEKGHTTEEEKSEIICKLAACLGCEAGEVTLTETESEYQVRAPIKNVIACADFLDISREENKAEYWVSGEIK